MSNFSFMTDLINSLLAPLPSAPPAPASAPASAPAPAAAPAVAYADDPWMRTVGSRRAAAVPAAAVFAPPPSALAPAGAISDADLDWALMQGRPQSEQDLGRVRALDGVGLQYRGDYNADGDPWRALTQADIDSMRAQQWDRNNPQNFQQARGAGLFGPGFGGDGMSATSLDEFLAQLFESKGLDEQQAIAAAKRGLAAHEAQFGQGYTTATPISNLFNQYIFPAAGVASDASLDSIPGWTVADAESRGGAARAREHGGDFGSATGLGQILSFESSRFGDTIDELLNRPEDLRFRWHGNTAQDSQNAQAKGIDTSGGEWAHQVAKTAVGGMMGAAGGDAAAGSEAASGAGAASGETVSTAGKLRSMFADLPDWAQSLTKSYGTNFVNSGGDPVAAAKSTAIGAGINYGANAAAPYINDTVDYFNAPADAGGGFDPRRMQLVAADTGMFDVQQPLVGPASVIGPDGVARSAQPTPMGGWEAPAAGQSFIGDPLNLGAIPGLSMPAAVSEQGDPTNPPPEPAKSNITSQDLQRYAKIGQQLYSLLGSEPDGPSRPAEDASQEEQQQYLADVVNYLGLDAQTMADAGLTPGSPEYTAYILDQADTIIAQVLGGIDVDSADLAQQLRTKTDKELQALQRALYVRGQLGQQMGAGTYTDPSTGNAEEVIGPGMFNPSTAAYQRGLAGRVNRLAGLQGADARQQLQGMLGRNSDMFGMQAQQDQRFEQAKLDDDEQRRRGMLAY